jgi:hypothetical protein
MGNHHLETQYKGILMDITTVRSGIVGTTKMMDITIIFIEPHHHQLTIHTNTTPNGIIFNGPHHQQSKVLKYSCRALIMKYMSERLPNGNGNPDLIPKQTAKVTDKIKISIFVKLILITHNIKI